jgi:hypothetical protein
VVFWLLWSGLGLLGWDWSGWLKWLDLGWCLVGNGMLNVVWGISWVASLLIGGVRLVWSLLLWLNWLWLGLVESWGSSLVSLLRVLVRATIWAGWLISLWGLLLRSLRFFISLGLVS